MFPFPPPHSSSLGWVNTHCFLSPETDYTVSPGTLEQQIMTYFKCKTKLQKDGSFTFASSLLSSSRSSSDRVSVAPIVAATSSPSSGTGSVLSRPCWRQKKKKKVCKVWKLSKILLWTPSQPQPEESQWGKSHISSSCFQKAWLS